jgi:diacylglycerol kinase family enzyme
MRGLLLYNPQAGRHREVRERAAQQVAVVLRGFGYEIAATATTHRGSAGEQVRSAISSGAEVIFAGGGDGTMHEVLQGIVGTSARLALIPFGSANALCRELAIPLNPIRAAEAYASSHERRIAIGGCVTSEGERHFVTMAGAGPSGDLMYRMLAVNRNVAGRWSYAWHALRLLLRSRFPRFDVAWSELDGTTRSMQAVSAMALRIGNLGGIFPGLSRGASLYHPTMRLILVKAPPLLGLPLWCLSSWLRLEHWNPLLQMKDVTSFTCTERAGRTHLQADGEWIGLLPATVELQPLRTVTMLLPGEL